VLLFRFSFLQSRIYPFERATSSYPTSVVVLVVVITFIVDDYDRQRWASTTYHQLLYQAKVFPRHGRALSENCAFFPFLMQQQPRLYVYAGRSVGVCVSVWLGGVNILTTTTSCLLAGFSLTSVCLAYYPVCFRFGRLVGRSAFVPVGWGLEPPGHTTTTAACLLLYLGTTTSSFMRATERKSENPDKSIIVI